MANTRRESTAHPRSENTSDAAGLGPIPALGFGPHISTAVHAIRQATTTAPLPIRDPWISRVGNAVDTAFALLSEGHGATVSVTDGNMAGRKLYAVSIYPERTLKLKAPPNWQQIFAYALKNVAVLLMPHRALGIWYNKPQKRYELDIVVCVANLTEALTLGFRYEQFFIYDLDAGQDIPVPRPSPEIEASCAGGRHA
jgi:hypothetical protein